MKKKLLAIDLDGTALNNQSLLSEHTIDTLKKVSQNGHHVAIVTGRPYRLALDFYRQLELDSPMVNFNGSLVVLPEKEWAGERQAIIERDLVFEILARKQQYSIDFLSAENKDHFYVDNFQHFEPTFFGATAFSEDNKLTPFNMRINPNSILVKINESMEKQKAASQIRADYGNHLDIHPWGGPNPILELVPKGVHKAFGVDILADYYGIQMTDVLAFGDEVNDLSMLQQAGFSVAMKNAREEIQAVADDVTDWTNDEDGLANYIVNRLKLA